MTPEVFRSKVKFRRIFFENKWFPSLSWKLFITELSYFTCYLVLLSAWLLLIVFFRERVKVTWVPFVEKRFPLSFLRSLYHRTFTCNVLIALSEAKTPIDFMFTRSNVKVAICKKQCKHGFCPLSWEMLITEVSNFTCRYWYR